MSCKNSDHEINKNVPQKHGKYWTTTRFFIESFISVSESHPKFARFQEGIELQFLLVGLLRTQKCKSYKDLDMAAEVTTLNEILKYIEIAGNWMLAMLVMLAWYHNDVFQRANFQSERQDPSGNGTARHSMTDPSDP
jgi:hypothetical protein